MLFLFCFLAALTNAYDCCSYVTSEFVCDDVQCPSICTYPFEECPYVENCYVYDRQEDVMNCFDDNNCRCNLS